MNELTFNDVNYALEQADLGFDFDLRVHDGRGGKEKVAVMEIRYHDITFEDLCKVSEALGTRRINLDNQVREEGYCDTCRHSYTVTVLTIMDVKIPADITTPEAT